MYCLLHQCIRVRRKLVETLSDEDCHVAPPLSSFSVRTVEVGVSHIDVKRSHGLAPETVDFLVRAGEAAFEFTVVSGLAITDRIDHYG